jgi:hypothetical protein
MNHFYMHAAFPSSEHHRHTLLLLSYSSNREGLEVTPRDLIVIFASTACRVGRQLDGGRSVQVEAGSGGSGPRGERSPLCVTENHFT